MSGIGSFINTTYCFLKKNQHYILVGWTLPKNNNNNNNECKLFLTIFLNNLTKINNKHNDLDTASLTKYLLSTLGHFWANSGSSNLMLFYSTGLMKFSTKKKKLYIAPFCLCASFVVNYRYMGLIVSIQMTHILIFLQKLSKENIMLAQEFKSL